MDRQPTSRRALLGTVAAIGAAAAIPAASASPIQLGVSPALAALIAEAEQREAVADRYERDVYGPAYARCEAAREAIPHTTFTVDDGGYTYSTFNRAQVDRCTAAVERQRLDRGDPQRRLVAAHKWRQRAIGRVHRASGLDVAYPEACRLGDAAADAANAVTRFPAATLPDLAAVVAFMESRGSLGDDDCVAALAAGIRRAAGATA